MVLGVKSVFSKTFAYAFVLAFLMLLTRGSHVLTHVSLPDASVAIFLLGGLLLQRWGWFAAFFVLSAVIDFGAAAFDPAQGFCLTDGYWGMIPSYAMMWLGGLWLAKQKDAFQPFPYALVSMLTSFCAFLISTQTYYLFSGRFPAQGLWASLQHGWEYLPSWMGYSAMYFVCIWVGAMALRQFKVFKTSKA